MSDYKHIRHDKSEPDSLTTYVEIIDVNIDGIKQAEADNCAWHYGQTNSASWTVDEDTASRMKRRMQKYRLPIIPWLGVSHER